MKRESAALKGGSVKLVVSRDYRAWINDLRKRYRAAQTKAAVSVNSALLEFYWNLGKDISEKYAATQYYGSRFFECVSKDLTDSIQNPQGLSVVNIRYCQRFYNLYSGLPILPQVVEELVSIPWGQHRSIIDKCKGDSKKAHFYVRGTIAMGWSRSQLEDELEADLYTRKGKSIDNFAQVLPPKESKAVTELVKSPYLFGLVSYSKLLLIAAHCKSPQELVSYIGGNCKTIELWRGRDASAPEGCRFTGRGRLGRAGRGRFCNCLIVYALRERSTF